MSSLEQYLQLYRAEKQRIAAGSCAPLNALREEQLALLEQHGLPTTRHEEYLYTDVEAALAPDYGVNLNRSVPAIDPYKAYRCAVPNLSTWLYFVVNDVVMPSEGNTAQLPEGVVVETLCQAAAKNPDFIAKYYHRAAGKNYDGIAAVNTLLAQDGILVHIPQGVQLKKPIQIVNVSAAKSDLMMNRRILVVAEEGAQGSILLCDHAEGEQNHLSTQVIEAFVAPHAQLDIYSIEETKSTNTRFSNLYTEQAEESAVSYTNVTLTNGKTRNRAEFRLLGENAKVEARGALMTDAEERVDNYLLVDHAVPQCTSEMLYKYVINGKSTGAFTGKVLVREGAQKSLSEQINANLLASPEARVLTQPMLEIYADDVKCNHGSSIGKMDENALFYMRQRGIEEQEARLLLQHAFVNEVLSHVKMEQLRDRLTHLVEMRFRGELSPCQGCKMCR